MIAVIGSINVDFVATAPDLPTCGQTVTGATFKVFPGGKGANQALACRLAGSAVMFSGLVGSDDNGRVATCLLEANGVDLSLLKKTVTPTGIASIFVGTNGDNMIISIPGANGNVAEPEVDQAIACLSKGDTLVLQMEIPGATVLNALAKARLTGVRTVLNIAPFTSDVVDAAGLADVVIMNETELEELGSALAITTSDLPKFFAAIRRSESQIFIVTRGENGATAFLNETEHNVCARKVTPVDTVGAGDNFVGHFVSALDSGKNVADALLRGTIAGSLACLAEGAQAGSPSGDAVDAWIATL